MSALPGAVETSGEPGKADPPQMPSSPKTPPQKSAGSRDVEDAARQVSKERQRLSVAGTLSRTPAIDHYKESTGLLDPRSNIMKHWDLWTAVLLLFTAIVTPYEVGFLSTDLKTAGGMAMFVINWIVDACFFADLFINFNLSYFDPEIGSGMWIVDRKKIVRHYLKGMFVIDLVSILPFGHIGLFMQDPTIEKLKIFRAVRLLRLVKLLRIIKSGKIIRQLEDNLSVDYNVLTLLKFIVATIMIAHWLACGWHLTARIEGARDNWWKAYFADPARHWNGDYSCVYSDDWEDPNWCDVEVFALEKYVAAFYWAMVTMSTIGYGDVTPVTSVERGYELFSIFAGTSVFAYVVGSVCTIVGNMDKKNNEFYELMDNLNAFMADTKLAPELRGKLRAYFRYRRRSAEANIYSELLTLMSPELRGEVAVAQCGQWLEQVPFFKNAPNEFVSEVAQILYSETFPQGEEIIKEGEIGQKMYIVQRGVVAGKGKVFTLGKVFGEDILGGEIVSTYTVRALTYSDCYALARVGLESILDKFGAMKMRLRQAATRKISKDALSAFTTQWKLIKSGNDVVPSLSPEEAASPGKIAMLKRQTLVREFCQSVMSHTPTSQDKPAFSLIHEITAAPKLGVQVDTVSPPGERDDQLTLSVGNGLESKDQSALLRTLNNISTNVQSNSLELASLRGMILSLSSRLDMMEIKGSVDTA